MIEIQGKIVSRDIFEEQFVCDLNKCKGICCVLGDAGAPLEKDETEILKKIYPKVKPFLRDEGIETIESQGTSVIDFDGEDVTPLIDNKECAYVIFNEKGMAQCGIEKAYEAGKIDYIKPISCHLYPIRITKYKDFDALNYDRWEICKEACVLGEKLKISVLDFLQIPIRRKYGDAFFEECKEVQAQWNKNI